MKWLHIGGPILAVAAGIQTAKQLTGHYFWAGDKSRSDRKVPQIANNGKNVEAFSSEIFKEEDGRNFSIIYTRAKTGPNDLYFYKWGSIPKR